MEQGFTHADVGALRWDEYFYHLHVAVYRRERRSIIESMQVLAQKQPMSDEGVAELNGQLNDLKGELRDLRENYRKGWFGGVKPDRAVD